MSERASLLGMSLTEMTDLTRELGESPFRAKQLHHWVYRHQLASIDEMHTLPKRFRGALAECAGLGSRGPATVSASADDTRKYLFPTERGGFVEAAVIPEGRRATLCLSTQVGCRRSCTFCRTARQGFQGNLTAGEILNQYHSLPERETITNVVYMGMGEPLDNLEATLASLALFIDERAYGFAPRRVTLSTVGIHPALERFLEASPVHLAVSLHSPFPEERRRIMPVENANPVERTVELLRSRREDRARRVSFEYTMFRDLNDTEAHVEGIAKLLNGLSVRVNLIPFHRIEDTSLEPTTPDRMESFAEALRRKGFSTSIRRSRGQDINAACGMLWTRHLDTRGQGSDPFTPRAAGAEPESGAARTSDTIPVR